jgi:hypothetical protein
MQDLFKPSIRLKEDIPICSLGTFPNESSSVPTPGTLSGENSPAPASMANLGASVGPIELSPGPKGEVAAVVRPPSPKAD